MTAGTAKKHVRRQAMTADGLRQRVHGLTAASFTEALHPRGKDGKFIEIGGIVNLFGKSNDPHSNDLTGRRGRVKRIEPHEGEPPNIVVTLLEDDDTPYNNGFMADVTMKPSGLAQGKEKARIRSDDIPRVPETIRVPEVPEAPGVPRVPEGEIEIPRVPESLGSREALEAQIPTGVNPDDAALLDNLRRRVHEFEATERASRWADAEVTVIPPANERAADEQLLAQLRERVHALEAKLRQRQPAMA